MVPVNSFQLEGNERNYLNQCVDSGWISSDGPFVGEFEKKFSASVGRTFGIAVANGSAALDIAVAALGIGPGDEVIMPAFTIVSPAFSVIRAGGIPVLVDSEADSWNMDVDAIEAKITPKTKAILVVHIYGLPAAMDKVMALAEKHSLYVIEDAAELHGQTFNGRSCGSFGDISTFSFYANKHVTTGEGGMLVCDDEALNKRCRQLRNLSFESDGPRFVHHDMGWNYRMTNMQAALGLAQLEQLETFIARKKAMGAYYQEHLHFLVERGFQLPLPSAESAANHYWVFGLVAPETGVKEDLLGHLGQHQIGYRPFFWCMHEQPVFRRMGLFHGEHYPIAEKLARNGFYIPSGLGLSQPDMHTVVSRIREFYG